MLKLTAIIIHNYVVCDLPFNDQLVVIGDGSAVALCCSQLQRGQQRQQKNRSHVFERDVPALAAGAMLADNFARANSTDRNNYTRIYVRTYVTGARARTARVINRNDNLGVVRDRIVHVWHHSVMQSLLKHIRS